ncbi:uncharacterized protein LY89DRAFT_223272 [Mollisia scopiformis]|uniref:PHD-type domain-containing protein n=1 Tax=Mollisia scopiformis TaxID=149040 RepID=A0A194WW01_MOLSC|nr:uncharacterized protein LY89DRAFT_223272 [Mollisia scopiformis]KUJ12146.1 hypothetical protein LY89DRAFT_223272 [Mollisia scopiformis]
MTSSSRTPICRVCKEPEELPSKPFVKCTQCRQLWHLHCHRNPDLDCSKAPPLGFVCGRCSAKMKASEASSSKQSFVANSAMNESSKETTNNPVAATNVLPQSLAKDTPPAVTRFSQPLTSNLPPRTGSSPVICEIPGCGEHVRSQTPNSQSLCFKHRVEKQYAKAKAQAPATNIPRASKPFNKGKIYPLRPDDKPYVKQKPKIPKRKSTTSELDMRPLKMPKRTDIQGHVASSGSEPIVAKSMPSRRRDASSVISPLTTTFLDRDSSLSSASAIKSPAIEGSASSSTPLAVNRHRSSNLLEESTPTRSTPGSSSTRPSPLLPRNNSPEYEPPPPQTFDHDNPWANEDGAGDSPGSQIAQELKANAEGSQQTDNLPPMLSPIGELHLEVSARASTSARPRTPEVPANTGIEDFLGHSELIDRLALEHVPSPNNKRGAPGAEIDTAIQSPDLPTDAGSGDDINMTDDADRNTQAGVQSTNWDEGWTTGGGPQTTLQKRLARGDVDENMLDSYFEKQRISAKTLMPTKADLEAQNWSSIDPRKAWPERQMDDKEIAAKVKQIEARGGRKANYGKIFTAQNLQEKEEKGWEMHQWSDRKDDDEAMERIKRLEELFGVEGLADFVPATRNGRLVMIERMSESPEDEPRGPGRRKRKREPRVFVVNGAPSTI